MTSPQGMDELFWGRDHEDVNDWAKRLTMVVEVKNCGIRCSFCNGLRHLEDHCWKKKETKPSNSIANYLEVLVNDEEATLIKLNMICGVNHHLSFGNRIPKRRLLMQANGVKGIAEQAKGIEARDRTREVVLDFGAR